MNDYESYTNNYNKILVESKRQKRHPYTQTRNSINFDSAGNQAAEYLQKYLNI